MKGDSFVLNLSQLFIYSFVQSFQQLPVCSRYLVFQALQGVNKMGAKSRSTFSTRISVADPSHNEGIIQ